MTATVTLSTQGISDDWLLANGDMEQKNRGAVNREQVISALLHLEPLDTPDGAECPPYVVIEGPNGSISFIGQGGEIECPEVENYVTPEQGTAVAFGEITIQSLAPVKSAAAAAPLVKAKISAQVNHPSSSKAMKAAGIVGAVLGAAMGGGITNGSEMAAAAATGTVTGVAIDQNSKKPQGLKRKNTWRQYILYTVAGLFGLFTILFFYGIFAEDNQDGRAGAVVATIIFAFITWGLIHLSRKKRPWVDDNGYIYSSVVMANMMGVDNLDDPGDHVSGSYEAESYEAESYEAESYDSDDGGGFD